MHTSRMTEPTDDPGMLGGKNLPMCPLCGNATFPAWQTSGRRAGHTIDQ